MKYCYYCNRMTTGEPVFCNFCGRSYNVKLCPRLHVNSRISEVCSQCGSRDLSTPQPKVPLKARIVVFLLMTLVGSALLFFTLFFTGLFLVEVVTTTKVLNDLIAIGIMLGILWWAWMEMPFWFRKLIYRLMERKRKGNDKH